MDRSELQESGTGPGERHGPGERGVPRLCRRSPLWEELSLIPKPLCTSQGWDRAGAALRWGSRRMLRPGEGRGAGNAFVIHSSG